MDLLGNDLFIDSHAHLDAPYFRYNLSEVIDRAQEADVDKIISIGVTPSSSRKTLQLAENYAIVESTVGYHPHWAYGVNNKRLSEIEELAKNPRVLALGEIGLDYHHFRSPKKVQISLFRDMLDIAISTKLPVVIHSREADDDVYENLSTLSSKLVGGVIHCFSGDWTLARKYLDMGFYLSISGQITYPHFNRLRKLIRRIPISRLLIETDAPHLTPLPKKGRKNEPAFVRYQARETAKLKGISLEYAALVTCQNVFKAFKFSK